MQRCCTFLRATNPDIHEFLGAIEGGKDISHRGHGDKAQRPRRGSEMFSVPSVIKRFGNSEDKTLRELCVKCS